MSNVITKKFAIRLINYIFDVWETVYVLNRLPELSIDYRDVKTVMDSISCQFPYEPSQWRYERCKEELLKVVLEKKVIIDI